MRRRGIHGVRVSLWVFEANARAIRFYARHGFGPDGERKEFDLDGALVPEIRMARPAGWPSTVGR